MPFRYFGSDIINTTGTAITAADTDVIYIAEGADIVATVGRVILAPSASPPGSVTVTVAGGALGGGIDLSAVTSQSSLYVERTGNIQSASNAVQLGGGFASLSNQGTITGTGGGAATIVSYAFSFYFYNSGALLSPSTTSYAMIASGEGTHSYINEGTIIGAFYLSDGIDRVVNRGLMDGDVLLSGGDDLYDGRGGEALRTVNGGTGNDALLGGNFEDRLTDYSGTNWIVGAGGDDTITLGADGSTDTVFAGEVSGVDNSANDTLVMETSTAVNVFLSNRYVATVAAGNPVVAWITGFENATGGGGNDYLGGTAGANILDGFVGGDWLVGGGGADTFRFSAIFQIAAGDRAADFRRSERDLIDISRIDANTGATGDQAFTFRTAHTSNTAGEVVVLSNGSTGATVNLYVNADNVIDATFFVAYGESAVTNMNAGDFIL